MDLLQHHEEEVFSEGDLAVTVDIDSLKDLRGVIFQVILSAFEERGVAIWSHSSEEVFVAHPHLTIFCLLSGKDFIALLWGREETDFVLIVAADVVSTARVFALGERVLTLLIHEESKGHWCQEEKRGVSSTRGLLAIATIVVITLLVSLGRHWLVHLGHSEDS